MYVPEQSSPVRSQVHKECPYTLWNNIWVGYTSICIWLSTHAFQPMGYISVEVLGTVKYISVVVLDARKHISVMVLDIGRYIWVEVLGTKKYISVSGTCYN